MRTPLAILALSALAAAQPGAPAVRLDPVDAILDALRAHHIVTLPGAHGGIRLHDLLLSVIRDPRAAGLLTDIVVEFGNSRYQDMADRFVRGEDVPRDALKRIWQDTTNPSWTHDTPHSEETLRAVRDVNATRPPDQRIRVLLGEPPIDWDHITRREDHRKWTVRRDSFVGDLIVREVAERGRRAIAVYGNLHFPRREILANYDMSNWQTHTLVSVVEAAGHKVFVIFGDTHGVETLQPDVAKWPPMSIMRVAGTRIGAADFAEINPATTRYVILGPDRFEPMPESQWQKRRVDEQVDAIIYLGPSGGNASLSRETCADPAYVPMRLARMKSAGIAPAEGEQLQKKCAAAVR